MDISCSICIEPFKSNCEVSTTKCGHVFHTKCITFWFQNAQNNCPKCRQLCQNNDFIKTYFDMETKTTTVNSSFFSYESLAEIIFLLLFILAMLLIVLFVFISETNNLKEKSIEEINGYTRQKEFDLGCYMWNEKMWIGNAPLKLKLSECGIDGCKVFGGKSLNRLIMNNFHFS